MQAITGLPSVNAPEDGLAAEGEGSAFFGRNRRKLANVGSRGEGAAPGAREEHDSRAGVIGCGLEGRFQFSEGGGVQRIEGFGAIECNYRQRRPTFHADIRELHARTRVPDEVS
jgi:hypothetical protein